MSIAVIDCADISLHPHCPHGPMVKFTKTSKNGFVQQFFGCSACREHQDCPFTLKGSETFSSHKLRAIDDLRHQLAPNISREVASEMLLKFKTLKAKKRNFCKSCFAIVFPSDLASHCGHELVTKVTDEMLSFPSQFVSARKNDKKEAQYWFDDNTKRFIVKLVEELAVDSVLCIGTPTVYEMVRSKGMDCLLLDIDSRYVTFYNVEEFGWFNMFNFFFLGNETESLKVLTRLLDSPRTCVIIDPPFGARLELLAYTIGRLRELATGNLLVFLALPYFMEPRVIEYLPDFRMIDYVLHYANHSKMKSHKKSAVRFFTNASLSTIRLPSEEGYKYCEKCDCWRHECNKHCDFCNTCPSKNATTYKHCVSCNACVKSTWEHCDDCERCFLAPHKCYTNASVKRHAKNQKGARKKKK